MLLYGFGSKRTLLTAFMQHLLSVDGEAAAVEVLGYSPHFTVKEVSSHGEHRHVMPCDLHANES